MRDDSGIREGYTVPRHYDTLLAKLIVWGVDRAAAIARMARALAEYKIVGVRTTIPVLERIVAHEDFRAGRLSTAFMDRLLPGLQAAAGHYGDIAVITAVLDHYARLRSVAAAATPASSASAWRLGVKPGWRSR
ncbi:MAG: hypothetical protein AUI04_07910 [Candidatus Rokubacteria bacterium 13_2_20CM_2_64_8]|nr:MAG: hypothetical protein AUI04_07910 [Candidatus Rokubacteria bacterium 13_2_20CM_2_64_8]